MDMLPRTFCIASFLGVVFVHVGLTAPSGTAAEDPSAAPVVIRFADAPNQAVSPQLFGQFLERFGAGPGPGGELGPQAAVKVDAPYALRADVMENLRKLRPTVLRFPGGMAVETHYNWTDLIDRSPWRDGPREKGWEFGYEEFFGLCRSLKSEPLVVVNFRYAVWGERPGVQPVSAEEMAAGLVAYCNLPVGAQRPEGMPDWAAIRAANGHPEPHGVRVFQIGNEWVAWLKGTSGVREKLGLPKLENEAAFREFVKARLLAVIRAMKGVDPSIKIIIDAVYWEANQREFFHFLLADEEIRAAADLAAVHLYRPWGVKEAWLDGQPIQPADASFHDLWWTAVATPNLAEDGQTQFQGSSWKLARSLGWRVALTEWNWNGWGVERPGACLWARALGAAGFLHAMLREANNIELATQSMMVGNQWHITGVRVEPERSFIMPSAAVTAFYGEHARAQTVALDIQGNPLVKRSLEMGSIRGRNDIAVIDAVATDDETHLVLHLIQRDPKKEVVIEFDPGGREFSPQAVAEILTGSPLENGSDRPFLSSAPYRSTTVSILPNEKGLYRITLPPACLSAVTFLVKQ